MITIQVFKCRNIDCQRELSEFEKNSESKLCIRCKRHIHKVERLKCVRCGIGFVPPVTTLVKSRYYCNGCNSIKFRDRENTKRGMRTKTLSCVLKIPYCRVCKKKTDGGFYCSPSHKTRYFRLKAVGRLHVLLPRICACGCGLESEISGYGFRYNKFFNKYHAFKFYRSK